MNARKNITILYQTIILLACLGLHPWEVCAKQLPMQTDIEFFRVAATEGTPGANTTLIMTATITTETDWYIYAHNPGGMGKPTTLTGTTHDELPLSPLYPAGIAKADVYDPSVTVNIYKSGTRIFVPIPKGGTASFPLKIRLDMLLCHPTKCLPARLNLEIPFPAVPTDQLPVAEAQAWWPEYIKLTPHTASTPSQKVDEHTPVTTTHWNFTPIYLQPDMEVTGFLSAILMGILAGLILNIMPCVLPVISLKLSALLNSSSLEDESARITAFREHNLFFVLGIWCFFFLLALILGGTGSAWGALFQQKWLVLGVAVVITALSLSLFGLFHLPIIDLKFDRHTTNPRIQAFFTGNLTTLLATPCSGPFLGGVLSWALIQGPLITVAVFVSIGLGMSLPYLLLIINPKLSRFLPKGGPWIEYVEKGVAFFLIGTAFYLVTIALGDPSSRILAPLWALLVGIWLWKQTSNQSPIKRILIRLVPVILFICLIIWTTPSRLDDNLWIEFDASEFRQELGNRPMFLDFTADWCPTCKALEATVLTPQNVQNWKEKYNILFIKVDMTEQEEDKESLLRALGSASIPTGAFFATGEQSNTPLVLRDLFTETQLENILKSWKK